MSPSPVVENWSQAGTYFSYANDPAMLSFWFWLCVVLCVIPLLTAMRHESEIAQRFRDRANNGVDPARAPESELKEKQ